MLALGQALARRGHEVTLQTWERWRAPVEAAGMGFAPAPEYHVFPTRERPLKPYEAVVRAAQVLEPELATLAPDAIVADILTLAPALAGERAGVPVATLIPHVDPRLPPGAPPYSLGARWPRTAAGRSLWRAADRVVRRGLDQGRIELNETRRRLGLPAHHHVHNGISRSLSVVGTFPQLEYPFPRPPGSHVVGPLLWEPPYENVELPPGDGPLVLVAPSTAQDAGHRLLRAALAGLADEPVRVLATWNRGPPDPPLGPVPANARVVDWLSYARTMPRCDLVVCHGGHGTVVRALASGCPVVIAPAAGDMNENAARVAWAGAGVRLPRRLVSPTTVRLAVVRALGDPSITARARELADWAAAHHGAQRAAELVEAFAIPSGAFGNIRSWRRDGLSSD
ncbi:MAG TPA: nucleotide disphospho-sugar-binding domain-containing protein [Solirubrobacteraceae bacterium]|nr:nucleotide disphospho-sugar-binding domain-containing protein [Solirubrobacteraceae bacterium]